MEPIEEIPVYVINLKERLDRFDHINQEFQKTDGLNITLCEAEKNAIGAIGLWNTIIRILKSADEKDEFIIICEDDHQFTTHYNKTSFKKTIIDAKNMGADILLGGVSSFTQAMQVSPDLFWVEKFSGTQFFVIYRKFFNTMLTSDFQSYDSADYKISDLTTNKMLIYPFISTQREFGYSDITSKNNIEGYVTQIFNDSMERLENLKQVGLFYKLKF
jgi:hypothetical protein